MRIVLFRHGPAGKRNPDRWPHDEDRPLTARGRERTRMASEGLARLLRRADRICASPLVRAAETAKLLAGALTPAVEVETLAPLAPGGSHRAIVRHLAGLAQADTVVLVGHEPDLGGLAGVLLFGAPGALALKKAGACAIAFPGPVEAGAGRLEWFLPPRMLRRAAARGRVRS